MNEFQSILAIAYRDFVKFLRDRNRLIATFIFPILFIGILGSSFQSGLGDALGYDYRLFVFLGVIAQTLFQSTAAGIISLTEDREQDFAQEIFVSPISRFTIVIGKIFGETLVAMAQIVGIVLFGFIIRVPFDVGAVLTLLPFFLIVAFFGGAFGILVVSFLGAGRGAREVFPFLIFPQFFLAGVFNPIKQLPVPLNILTYVAPMRYAVDLLRSVYYAGSSAFAKTVLLPFWVNLLLIAAIGAVFFIYGTYRFTGKEQNR